MSAQTVVLQSQRPDRLEGWQGRCCASVRAWAQGHGHNYHFLGDELFDLVAKPLREKFCEQPVVLSDYARLLWLREHLDAGAATVVWCDADILIFHTFTLGDYREAFGRENWLQMHERKRRRYRKIHNAWLQFRADSPVLDFYIDRARHLLEATTTPVVPQFIGPKVLTAWHNIAPFTVEERVGVMSPLALHGLLDGDLRTLGALKAGHAGEICALNLCASSENLVFDDWHVTSSHLDQAVDLLLEQGL